MFALTANTVTATLSAAYFRIQIELRRVQLNTRVPIPDASRFSRRVASRLLFYCFVRLQSRSSITFSPGQKRVYGRHVHANATLSST